MIVLSNRCFFPLFVLGINVPNLVHIPAYSGHFQSNQLVNNFPQIHKQAGLDMKNSTLSNEKRFKEKKLPLTIFKKSCAVAL